MEVRFATQPPNQFGNETQLVRGAEGLYRSLGLVVTWVRQVARPHDHTIPLFAAGTPLQRYNSGLILALHYNLCNTTGAPAGYFTFSTLAGWRFGYLAEIEEEDDAKDDKVQ